MGATVCGEEQPPTTSFTEHVQVNTKYEWEGINDETVDQNYQKFPSDVPSRRYGKRIDRRPILFPAVQLTKSSISNLMRSPENRGTPFPVYYHPSYQAYYQGEWKAGEPSGYGKMYFANGAFFEGGFAKGEIYSDDGLYIYPDGAYKRGNVRNGDLNGQGLFVTSTGLTYKGQWVNGQPNGKGVEQYPDGSSYEGNFVNGLKDDDHGVYRWANGKQYVGQFKQGYMEGNGRLFMSKGKGEYVGLFNRNLKVGRGIMKTETGVFEGNFVDGEMQGPGTFTWADGKKYVGDFDHGELHGNGEIQYPNGQVVKGVWNRGINQKMEQIKSGV